MDFAHVLKSHADKYPNLTPQDVIKLIYQSAYGCVHFVDTGRAEAYIREEMTCKKKAGEPLFEPIGNGRARLMFNSPEASGLSPELIARLFAASARCDAEMNAKEDKLEEYTSVFLDEARNGAFAFSLVEAERFLECYRASGGGAVHHSEEYRKSYAPAYRVFSPVAVKTLEVCKLAHEMLLRGTEPKIALIGDDEAALTNARAFISSVFGDSVHFVAENYDAVFSFAER
ncbi:MAG: hypothetical protein IKM09_00385 [Clostridia bacterium]|nr:hypothetical protein [Clostridia bacterium]